MLENKAIANAMTIKLDLGYPEMPEFQEGIRRAPDRGFRLTKAQTKIALRNALRYVPEELHEKLAPEFMAEYMHTDTDRQAASTANRSMNTKETAWQAKPSRS